MEQSNKSNYLQSQIYLYSVDTSAFLSKEEAMYNRKVIKINFFIQKVEKLIQEVKSQRIYLSELISMENKNAVTISQMSKVIKTKEMATKINRLSKVKAADYQEVYDGVVEFYKSKLIEKVSKYQTKITTVKKYRKNEKEIEQFMSMSDVDKVRKLMEFESSLNKLVKKSKTRVEEYNEYLTDEKLSEHKGMRKLNPKSLTSKRVIGQFASTLTRTLCVETGTITSDIIVIRAYRYAVFKELVINGFENELGERFQYFASSSGQIRQKKSLFIKKSVWEKYKGSLMCGLTVEGINEKSQMNLNKYNAYLALCNTSSVEWVDFKEKDLLNHAIVVDDFKTLVSGEVDYIDKDYNITRGDKDDIQINHTDGAGMILPSVSEKSFMVRMPFFKGLLISFPFDKFIDKREDASPIVKDIYNREWDIIKDDIRIIFTKSQFKAWSQYDSWEDYKTKFRDNNCQAAIAKEEEEEFNDKRINYQMIQTLYKMEDSDLEYFCSDTKNEIERIGKDKATMLKVLGADDSNESKYGYQRALEIYPEMLREPYTKEQLMEKKRSLVKDAKAGKILIPGTKRSFISPDLYAFSEWLFCKIKKPNGLLKDGEVSCSLFGDQKLSVLRSPHLYLEHSVNDNVVNDETKEWFVTKDIYTSTHSLISKILQFDCDGDDSLIVSESRWISISEEHMKDIRPLVYELGTAKPEKITNPNIYTSLVNAYSKNIGQISNTISKVFNKPEPNLEVASYLVYENNAIIDFAKTLWMPKRPKEKNTLIKENTDGKVPFYFRFAKDKPKTAVAKKNNSVMNRLGNIIPSTRICFEELEGLGEFDYKRLMKNQYTKSKKKDEIIKLYDELNHSKYKEIKKQLKDSDKKRKKAELFVYKEIREKLLKVDKKNVVIDILIQYLYGEVNSPNKQTLWYCFGDDIARNLDYNINGIKRCEWCNEEIEKQKAKKFCSTCAEKREKARKR